MREALEIRHALHRLGDRKDEDGICRKKNYLDLFYLLVGRVAAQARNNSWVIVVDLVYFSSSSDTISEQCQMQFNKCQTF